jgi:hypothetical protein
MINKYPYHIRIKEPNLIDILEKVAKNKTLTIKTNGNLFRTLGIKLKPVRKDAIFMGIDRRYYESNISLKDPFQIESKPFKKGREFIFKI